MRKNREKKGGGKQKNGKRRRRRKINRGMGNKRRIRRRI